MPSKSRPEGYILIDNRVAPPERGIPRFLEAAVMSCGHCRAQVIRNPERERARAYCRSCDHYICDFCAAKDECRPFDKLIDQLLGG